MEPNSASSGGSWVWPVAIIVGMVVVMAVNGAFIYIAVSGADEVVESYESGER
ncbi:MAG: FixH family protein [Gemmatimonadota bacterium]|nr:FixH family protein [Gemmatimonadota bacterium]MDH5760621.1 FixH family protein [Gemmatimonadota bacterium]